MMYKPFVVLCFCTVVWAAPTTLKDRPLRPRYDDCEYNCNIYEKTCPVGCTCVEDDGGSGHGTCMNVKFWTPCPLCDLGLERDEGIEV